MGAFDFLLQGLATAADPMMLLYALIGVTLGTAVGVLPGIGPALTVALLLPVTYRLDAAGSLIMFAGIYYGGMYGGSTTSILLNTPGESASIITALEGNKMARKGRGGPALATAAIGSFVAGLIATLLLAFLAPQHRQAGAVAWPARIFRADGAGLCHRLGRLRRFGAAGADLAVSGAGLACVGIDQLTGRRG
jgi:putative tricarboxylic transport membrane protein